MSYFIALHEVGHVVTGLGGKRLDREGKAWTFALRNAIIEPDYRERQRICALLVRYYFRAKEEGWAIPKRGDFWNNMMWW